MIHDFEILERPDTTEILNSHTGRSADKRKNADWLLELIILY